MTQEALANVARHARASNVRVQLGTVSGFLQVSVEDDGAGFDPAQASGGMGVANMRARAAEFGGRFALDSSPGGGARVTAAVPLTPLFDEAGFRRRLWLYGGAVAGFLAAGMWRNSAPFYTMAVIFSIHFVRTLMARADARRSLGDIR